MEIKISPEIYNHIKVELQRYNDTATLKPSVIQALGLITPYH